MADKKIKVQVQVDTDVEPSLAALRALKKQLRETAAGSEEFIALQRKIDDIQDSLAGARAGAGNFADVLGALPGPIGAIGGQASGLITTLKQFGGLQLSNIQASFVELGADITDVAKGFFNLTGITKVYTVLNTALARSFVAVGVGEVAAAAGAKAFAAALTATGIGALVVGLGLLIANWDKVTDAIKGATAESKTYDEAQTEVTKSVTDFNKQLINVQNAFKGAREGTISKKDALKTYNDTIGKTVGFAGSLEQAEALMAANTTTVINGIKLRTQAQVFYAKSAEAAAKAVSGEGVEPTFWESVGNYITSGGNQVGFMIKQAKTLGENYGDLNEKTNKFAAEGDKLTKAAIENDKLLKKGLAAPPDFSATTKASNDALAEIKKGLEEARLTLLGEQERELEVVKLKYDELANKAKKYGKDTKLIEEAREKENAAIRDKFAKQQLEKDEKAAKDAKDLKEKALTEAQKVLTDATALEEAQLNLKLAKGEVSEKEYQNKLFDIRKNAAIKNEALVNDTLKKEQDSLNNQRIADLANLQIALQNEESTLQTALDNKSITQEQYDTKLLEAKNKFNTDSLAVTQTYQTNVDALNADALTKNRDFIAAQIDLEKYKTDQKKLTAEEERQILLSGLQSEFEVLDRANKQSELDFEQDMVRFGEQRAILAEMEAADLANEDLTEFQKTEIRKKYADQRTAIVESEIATERAAMQAKHEINMAYLGLFEQFGNLLGQIAGKNKAVAIAGIVISQAAAIGQIIANTAIANAKSVAALPLTFGQPWVAINTISAGLSIASTIASAAKSIAQINSQPGGSGGSSSAGATGGSSAAQLPKPPTVSGAAAPQIQSGQGINPTTQIAQTIGAAQKPIKAYVVSGDVSSQQALDRRTSRAATFTGG
jgi:hypothetical protein